MANLVHNYPDLRVYDVATRVAWTPRQMRDDAALGLPHIVRRACLRGLESCGSLTEALKIADDTLAEITRILGANCVRYTWGLYPGINPYDKPGGNYDSSAHPLLPEGHSLVAEVDNLTPYSGLTRVQREQLVASMTDIVWGGEPISTGHTITDLGTRHFVVRYNTELRAYEPQATLADMEPRLGAL